MGKFLAWMLLSLVAALTLVPAAGAAEIPPTGKCAKTTKKLLVKWANLPESDSSAQYRKAERKFMLALAKADCISDAEPLLKNLEPEPFSEKCEAAAEAAEGYWGPLAVKVRNLTRPWNRKVAPVRKRLKRLNNRIRNLRAKKASPKRIKALIQGRNVERARKDRLIRQFIKQADPILRPAFPDTFLILLELTSLRCLAVDYTFDNSEGPAGRVIEKRETIILTSLLYELFRALALNGKSGAVEVSASSVADERPTLPYIPIP